MTRPELKLVLAAAGILALFAAVAAAAERSASDSPLRVYEVNRKVSDFPDGEDSSTPEAAYATINRLGMASGDPEAWVRLSVESIAERIRAEREGRRKRTVRPEEAAIWLNAKIIEVHVFREKRAVVLAELQKRSGGAEIDLRSLELEEGRWLNVGQDIRPKVEDARERTAQMFAYLACEPPVREPVEDPEEYLKRYVDFLKEKGEDPKEFVMRALGEHRVFIMGEVHHRPRYWAFDCALVEDPRFAERVGVIYMELPPNDQGLIDAFLENDKLDTGAVLKTLGDIFHMGWPDQAMLDFFVTVWKTNQNLPPEKRVRIVLVDMQRPWDKIHGRGDWAQYEMVPRDKQMADNILADLGSHAEDARNALFIVGVAHGMLDFQQPDGAPVMSAGWRLREALGRDAVYAVFPHMPVQTNMGEVSGRLAMGLFESAFAANDNKPVAFPLDEGPFGEERFDAMPDQPVDSLYRDGYSAFLYLGPLEDEVFSPIIEGFYTAQFVKEADRRFRVSAGKGWGEAYGRELSPESFEAWMGTTWGQPRRDWQEANVGPVDAWQYGGANWRDAVKAREEDQALGDPAFLAILRKRTERLLQALQEAPYENIYTLAYDEKSGRFDADKALRLFPKAAGYDATGSKDKWVEWITREFKDNPVVSFETKEAIRVEAGRPAIPYKITLRDGRVLEGAVPFEFEYAVEGNKWVARGGLDWHLMEAGE